MDINGNNVGTIFYAKLRQSGSTSTSGTAEIEIPKNATQIYFDVNANNDDNPSNVTCQVSDITLVEKRVSAKLGETDVSEVYLGSTEISELFLGDRGL